MKISELLRSAAKEVSQAQANKPQLRGLHHATIKRNLAVALVLCTITVAAVKICHNDKKKADYAEFYKNYDANKSFERMKAAGLLNSVK